MCGEHDGMDYHQKHRQLGSFLPEIFDILQPWFVFLVILPQSLCQSP